MNSAGAEMMTTTTTTATTTTGSNSGLLMPPIVSAFAAKNSDIMVDATSGGCRIVFHNLFTGQEYEFVGAAGALAFYTGLFRDVGAQNDITVSEASLVQGGVHVIWACEVGGTQEREALLEPTTLVPFACWLLVICIPHVWISEIVFALLF